jgi:hypothetical protein
MCAANGLRAGFGEAEMLNLTLLNQILYRSGNFFDRHFRIDAVLIEQIDGIDLESLQRGLSHLLNMLGTAIQGGRAFGALGSMRVSKPNLVAMTT